MSSPSAGPGPASVATVNGYPRMDWHRREAASAGSSPRRKNVQQRSCRAQVHARRAPKSAREAAKSQERNRHHGRNREGGGGGHQYAHGELLHDPGDDMQLPEEIHGHKHEMVLTSIKGTTPLYMSPELMEEKANTITGCGTLWPWAAFFTNCLPEARRSPTNNNYRACSARWSTNPSTGRPPCPAGCRSFLQGLLQKDPRKRLNWPELLRHEWVVDGIDVDDATIQMRSKFTQPLSASQNIEREKTDQAEESELWRYE
uniref:non-specific serine/threonine protein kinase n=1 Tax=Macrostomum lignano TaxID=282301 RepID=A0A1I8F569_9PLAT